MKPSLQEGENTITLNATADSGKKTQTIQTITLDSQPPKSTDPYSIELKQTALNQTTVTGKAGSSEPGSTIIITNPKTDQSGTTKVNLITYMSKLLLRMTTNSRTHDPPWDMSLN